jgi:hypothetical protein
MCVYVSKRQLHTRLTQAGPYQICSCEGNYELERQDHEKEAHQAVHLWGVYASPIRPGQR